MSFKYPKQTSRVLNTQNEQVVTVSLSDPLSDPNRLSKTRLENSFLQTLLHELNRILI